MGRGSSVLGRLLLGSRKLRVGLAVVLVVALLGAGTLQLLPVLDRKQAIEAAETTTGNITEANTFRNQYSVTYEYTVDGQRYESSHVFPRPYAPGGTASPEVIGLVAKYETGENATVYYLPSNPDYAWLTTRPDMVSRHVVYFVAAGILAVLLVAYLYVELKLARRRDDRSQGPGQPIGGQPGGGQPGGGQPGGGQPGGGQLGGGQPRGGQHGSGNLFALIGRILGVLKTVAFVLVVGVVVVVGSGVVLLQFLTP